MDIKKIIPSWKSIVITTLIIFGIDIFYGISQNSDNSLSQIGSFILIIGLLVIIISLAVILGTIAIKKLRDIF